MEDELEINCSCGGKLVKVDPENYICTCPDNDELPGCCEYECDTCKTRYAVTPCAPEEREYYPYYNEEKEDGVPNCNHGFEAECPICGHYLVWSSEFMRSEVVGDVPISKEGEEKIKKYQEVLEKYKSFVENNTIPEEDKEEARNKIQELHSKISRVYDEDTDDDMDTIVHSMTCPHCGASIYIIEPFPEKNNDNNEISGESAGQ